MLNSNPQSRRPYASRRIVMGLLVSVLASVFTSAPLARADPYRLVSISFDHDVDGVIDGVQTYLHDANGRFLERSYQSSIPFDDPRPPYRFITIEDESDAIGPIDRAAYNPDGTLRSFTRIRNELGTPGSMTADATIYFYDGEEIDLVSTGFASGNDLDYSSGRLDLVEFLAVPGDFSQATYLLEARPTYDAGGYPESYETLNTPSGIDESTLFSFDPAGRLGSLATREVDGSTVTEIGSAVFLYDALGRVEHETRSGESAFGEFPRVWSVNYRKDTYYDALGRKEREDFDLDDDGSLDARRTFLWEEASCIPFSYWEPDGYANAPIVAPTRLRTGTGVTSIDNCGPATTLPEPSGAWAIGLLALAAYDLRRWGAHSPRRHRIREGSRDD